MSTELNISGESTSINVNPEIVTVNVTNGQGPKGEKGDTGNTGPAGPAGAAGSAATVTVGTVTTGQPGTNAVVTNSGSTSAAVLNFTIPRGSDAEISGLNDLTDVTITSPTNNQVLKYNGSEWVNATSPNGASQLKDLTDVLANNPVSGEFLKYNGSNWVDSTIQSGDLPSHTHSISNITNLQTSLDGKAASVHTHAISAITNLQTSLDGKSDTGHGHAISDITLLQTTLDGKAASSHTHSISNVTGLQTALDGKAASSHGHSIADVTGLQTSLDGKASSTHGHIIGDVTGLQTALDGKATSVHSHIIGDVTGLQTALDGKAASVHTHAISDVTNLQSSLDGKVTGNTSITGATKTKITFDSKGLVLSGADLSSSDLPSHSHIVGDVTGLQTILDGKASTTHGHIIGDVTGLQTALDGKSSSTHSHIIGDVTGLQTALDGKASSTHSHIIGDVTGLQTALDGKASSSHSHTISDVTNLQTSLDGKASSTHSHSISDVTNLQTTLDGKVVSNTAITGATKTKISYDTKGLVTAGADAAIADITGLQTALDGKASSTHSHSISDVTNLQTTLDGKASSSHSHIIGDVTGLQTALDSKAASSHSHSISDVTNLQTSLDAKVTGNVSITGATKTKITYDSKGLVTAGADAAIADITGLQTALDGKASSTHTHAISDVTNLQTSLDGKVAGNAAITGATKTKVTYDSKGLVTAGADAVLDDLGDVVITTPSTNQVLTYNGTNWVNAAATGGVSDGDKGDITVSNGGTTWTIDAGAVTYADIQNVAANSFLANVTGSAATVQAVATTRIPLFASAITGTPSASTYLRGDGSWATVSGTGISTLNTLTDTTQSFAVGTSGTNFNISSATGVHTFNIPDASATARGLITTGAQTIAGAKTFSSAPTFSTMTSGSVLFAGASGVLSQNNSRLFWDNTNNRLGVGISPTTTLQVLRGTAGTMAKNFYESASFEYNGDHKLGIYTSSSVVNDGASIQFGQTNLLTNTSYYSGFDWQYQYSATAASNYFRTNYVERNASGQVINYAAGLLSIYADGVVFVHPVATLGATASGKLVVGKNTNSGETLQVSGTSLLSGNVTISDGSSIIAGSTNGLKIGSATTQKLGFFNKAPVVQPTTAVAAAAFVANTGTAVNDASTFGGYTMKQVVQALQNLGLLA